MNTSQILDAYQWRHACKEFDTNKKINQDDFTFLLEIIRLSPSSFGLQPYEVFVLQNPQLLQDLFPHIWGAQKQLPGCSHFLMFAAKKDITVDDDYFKHMLLNIQDTPTEMQELRCNLINDHQLNEIKMVENPRFLYDWAARQAYIGLGNLMTTAALIGIDSCPVEGFVTEEVQKILTNWQVINPAHFQPLVFCCLGYRLNPPSRPKLRKPLDELVTYII